MTPRKSLFSKSPGDPLMSYFGGAFGRTTRERVVAVARRVELDVFGEASIENADDVDLAWAALGVLAGLTDKGQHAR